MFCLVGLCQTLFPIFGRCTSQTFSECLREIAGATEPALPCNFRHTAGGIRQQFNAFGNAVLGQVGHGSLIQVALEDGTAAAAADKSGGCDIL